MRYYADSCIWIDFLKDRYEIDLFEDCLKKKEELLISDVLMDELSRYILLDNMKVILHLFDSRHLLFRVISTPRQRTEAQEISKERDVPSADVLHAIIARDYNATLVTRDRHSLRLRDICKVELY
ncbi:MAG: PIN domain-containing protein [Candidatus Woesearchaeota archaeon]